MVEKWRIVLKDIIEAGMNEREVEEKYRLQKGLIRRWYADEEFRTELIAAVKTARLRAMAMMGQSTTMAMTELVSLARCGKEETRRKACMDIIRMQIEEHESERMIDKPKMKISDEEASAVMRALAEVRGKSRQS